MGGTLLQAPEKETPKVFEAKEQKKPQTAKWDLPGMEASELEKIFSSAVEKQKSKAKPTLDEIFSQDPFPETAKPESKSRRAHHRSRAKAEFNLEGLTDEEGNSITD